MDNKNNAVIILLVVLIGVVAGVGLLIGIENAVRVATSPLDSRLASIERREMDIQKQINALDNLKGMEGDVAQVKNILTSITTRQPVPAQAQPPAEDLNKIYDIPVGISSVLGDKNAPVTITEFSDFQCPFCNRFYSMVKDALAAYPGKLRVVIKNFPLPFHPNARPAAKLAMAANEQGKFQGMMEELLNNGGDVSDAKIKQYAHDLGLNYDKLMADYKNKDAQWEKQIQDDMTLAGSVDVEGTPTFYLNGRKTNARDIASLKAEVDPILAKK